MKKYLLPIFMGLSFYCSAQDSEDKANQVLDGNKHEFRIDALEGLIVPAFDVSYEYIISKYSGAGMSLYINLGDSNGDYQDFAVTPYYRQYFFNKKDFGARGFFGEGILQYSSGKTYDYLYTADSFEETEESWDAFGIGFALGQKWVSDNGFIIEISLGGGRNIGNTDFAPEAFFRGGVSVGYRF